MVFSSLAESYDMTAELKRAAVRWSRAAYAASGKQYPNVVFQQ